MAASRATSSGVAPKPARSIRWPAWSKLQSEAAIGARSLTQEAGDGPLRAILLSRPATRVAEPAGGEFETEGSARLSMGNPGLQERELKQNIRPNAVLGKPGPG